MTALEMVTVYMRLGLVMDIVMVLIRHFMLISAAMILMVVIAQKKNVPVAELKSLLASRKARKRLRWLSAEDTLI